MSKSINQVILLGNLTRDPELKAIPSGQNVCSFSLAVNRSWQGSDGQTQDAVDYFDVTAWGKLGELVSQYLSKGRKCLVMGRLSQRSWEQDGQKRSKVEVVASDVTFLDGAGSDTNADRSHSYSDAKKPKPSTKPNAKTNDVVIEDIDDKPIDLSEIPF
jgi:single-strand DNA-binding protein